MLLNCSSSGKYFKQKTWIGKIFEGQNEYVICVHLRGRVRVSGLRYHPSESEGGKLLTVAVPPNRAMQSIERWLLKLLAMFVWSIACSASLIKHNCQQKAMGWNGETLLVRLVFAFPIILGIVFITFKWQQFIFFPFRGIQFESLSFVCFNFELTGNKWVGQTFAEKLHRETWDTFHYSSTKQSTKHKKTKNKKNKKTMLKKRTKKNNILENKDILQRLEYRCDLAWFVSNQSIATFSQMRLDHSVGIDEKPNCVATHDNIHSQLCINVKNTSIRMRSSIYRLIVGALPFRNC